MNTCKRQRFPSDIISYTIWLYYHYLWRAVDQESLPPRSALGMVTWLMFIFKQSGMALLQSASLKGYCAGMAAIPGSSNQYGRLKDSLVLRPLCKIFSTWVGTWSGLNIIGISGQVRLLNEAGQWPETRWQLPAVLVS